MMLDVPRPTVISTFDHIINSVLFRQRPAEAFMKQAPRNLGFPARDPDATALNIVSAERILPSSEASRL